MTNYIDGRWNGWNDGECPVPFHTMVEVCFDTGEMMVDEARNLPWEGSFQSIIAYRVSHEHRKPREFWIDPDRQHVLTASANVNTSAYIHVREVIE